MPEDYPEIKSLIEKSGNNFHYQVVNFLREQGWYVLVSPYYTDAFTDKPREIDILAEKQFPAQDFFGQKVGNVSVQLFIECKYVNGDVVFWFDKKNQERTIERIMSDTGMDHPRRNTTIQKHHYFSIESVAKLFASKTEKSQENEIFFKAITQSLNALTYYRQKASFIPDEQKARGRDLSILRYPLIICNSFDRLYSTTLKAQENTIEKIENTFTLEVNYAYPDRGTNRTEFFLIDVIGFNFMSEFLKLLEDTDIREVGRQAVENLEEMPEE